MHQYFAYGSNLSLPQIRERCPNFQFVDIAELRDFRLGFTRYSKRRQGGVADIVSEPGASVWGAVFALNEADLRRLDGYEKPWYQHRIVSVQGPDSELEVLTYEVVDKAAEHHPPSRAYLEMIIEGAIHWGLPQDYCSKLLAIEVKAA